MMLVTMMLVTMTDSTGDAVMEDSRQKLGAFAENTGGKPLEAPQTPGEFVDTDNLGIAPDDQDARYVSSDLIHSESQSHSDGRRRTNKKTGQNKRR
jgi:hypothetical protein